jgi:hypothetical protein
MNKKKFVRIYLARTTCAGIKKKNTGKKVEIHRTLPVVFNKADVMFTDVDTCEKNNSTNH